MATRKSPEPLAKVTLNLFAGDWERIQTLFPIQGGSLAIRRIVRAFVRRAETAIEDGVPAADLDHINIGVNHE